MNEAERRLMENVAHHERLNEQLGKVFQKKGVISQDGISKVESLIERHKSQIQLSISEIDLQLFVSYLNLRTQEKLTDAEATRKIAKQQGKSPAFIKSEIRRITSEILKTAIHIEVKARFSNAS